MSKQSDAQFQVIERPRGHGKATLIPNMVAIIRELAESDPLQEFERPSGLFYCFFCNKAAVYFGTEKRCDHRDTCLWLRARKLAGIS